MRLEKSHLRKVLTGGKQVKRFHINAEDRWLIYTQRQDDFSKLPRIRSYIDRFKGDITCTEVRDRKHSLYALHRARKEGIFLKRSKILGVITADRIIVAPDDRKLFATDGLYVFGVREAIDQRYLLGILNSRLFVCLYRLLASEKGRVLAQVKLAILRTLPIRTIDFSKKSDVKKHDRVVALVRSTRSVHERLALVKTPDQRTRLERQLTAADRQIDVLVYELYSLTRREIEIVEARSK